MELPMVERILELPRAFDVWQRFMRAPAAKRKFVEEHVRARPGERVLDIGCATGALREWLPPETSYVGVEIDERYVDAARKRFGSSAEFVCADITTFRAEREFDVAMAYGIFHHLDDDQAEAAVAVVRQALREPGRLVACEPLRRPGQAALERLLLRSDRGKHVRSLPEWVRLLETGFGRVETHVVPDAFRLPYTVVVMHAHPA